MVKEMANKMLRTGKRVLLKRDWTMTDLEVNKEYCFPCISTKTADPKLDRCRLLMMGITWNGSCMGYPFSSIPIDWYSKLRQGTQFVERVKLDSNKRTSLWWWLISTYSSMTCPVENPSLDHVYGNGTKGSRVPAKVQIITLDPNLSQGNLYESLQRLFTFRGICADNVTRQGHDLLANNLVWLHHRLWHDDFTMLEGPKTQRKHVNEDDIVAVVQRRHHTWSVC